MNTGIVICSREFSSRIPRKAFADVGGSPLIAHLAMRLRFLEAREGGGHINVHVAVPFGEREAYTRALRGIPVVISEGDFCPLQRMAHLAAAWQYDRVVRICHDKLYVDREDIAFALSWQQAHGMDYVYSSSLPDGSGFEVIGFDALWAAALRFSDREVEHVSYAVRCMATKQGDVDFSRRYPTSGRLLVDWPEDLDVLREVHAAVGTNGTGPQAHGFLGNSPGLLARNRLPIITVYTCARNAEEWIDEAMASVVDQIGFDGTGSDEYHGRYVEYLLVDDGSTDKTLARMVRHMGQHFNVKVIKNPENVGLASSSNIALAHARGKYIVRLDADDRFCSGFALRELLKTAEETGADVVYPDNWQGERTFQAGEVEHHIGGALFRTRAANHVKFTDGLRGYDGLDFWTRARNQLKVAYLKNPVYFYRQRPDSMSKTDLEERARIRERITGAPDGSDAR